MKVSQPVRTHNFEIMLCQTVQSSVEQKHIFLFSVTVCSILFFIRPEQIQHIFHHSHHEFHKLHTYSKKCKVYISINISINIYKNMSYKREAHLRVDLIFFTGTKGLMTKAEITQMAFLVSLFHDI